MSFSAPFPTDTVTVRDCFDKQYSIWPMAGTGFCGFHCLSQCLTGNQRAYHDIIEDCITVFRNIPELFRLRTNFGARSDSSLTVDDYRSFMNDAVSRVNAGLDIDADAWCEDGHLAAISILYDVVIFTYSLVNKQWHVFNESARRGYVTLLSLPGHFDLLTGLNGSPPVIPRAAHTHGVSRGMYDSSDHAVWQSLQRNYLFTYVYQLPDEFTGVEILNRPVVPAKATANHSTVSGKKKVTERKELSVHRCEFAGCHYVSDNANAVKMHNVRCHRTGSSSSTRITGKSRQKSDSHVNSVECVSSENVTSASTDTNWKTVATRKKRVYECDFPSCSYSSNKVRAMNHHKTRCHSLKPSTLTLPEMQHVSGEHCPSQLETDRESVGNEEDGETDVGIMEMVRIMGHRKRKSPIGSNETVLNQTTTNGRAIKRKKGKTVHNIIASCDRSSACFPSDTDVSSVLSLQSTGSRRSERIAQRPVVSYGKSVRERSTCQTQYVCDITDCSAAYDTARGLNVHKTKCHHMDMRKSTRNCNQKRKFTEVDAESQSMQTKHFRAHTAADTSLEHTAEYTEATMENTHIEKTKETKGRKLFNSAETKQDTKCTFSAEIAELEKEFLPRKKGDQQSDPLYDKLKTYHDRLLDSVSNTTTQKLSAEVKDVIKNPAVIDHCNRKFHWSDEDAGRLSELNKTSKLLQSRSEWIWGAADDTEQGRYNDKRMQLCLVKECIWKIVECDECQSTGLLVGDQTNSKLCYDCLKLRKRNEQHRQEKQQAWNKVRPKTKEFPKAADGKDLPCLQPGDKAVLAPVHPVVTLKKNFYADKRFRQESISLLQDPIPTWSKFLPRTSLANRFMIIERRVRDADKYIVANADRVRQWLRYLFLNHKEFIRLQREKELVIDEDAIDILKPNLELAEVDSSLAEHTAEQAHEIEHEIQHTDEGLTDATGSSGLSENHVFSFDRYENLYMKPKDVLRIRKQGKLEIVNDPTVRKPTYSACLLYTSPSPRD